MMVINKLKTCNQDTAPEVYKKAWLDMFRDLATGQHICYRTNNYEIQRKVWVSAHDHFQKMFDICNLDMDGPFLQKEYDILIGTTDRLNNYLQQVHGGYMKYTEMADNAIFGTPADNYAVNDSPELRQLDNVEEHVYNAIGNYFSNVQNGLQDRKRRFNANMKTTSPEQMKKEIREQANEDVEEYIEFAAYYIDEVCWRNVYLMQTLGKWKKNIDTVTRDLTSVISDNDYN